MERCPTYSPPKAATVFYLNTADTVALRRKQLAELAPVIQASGAKGD